jgi:hypothetical protein
MSDVTHIATQTMAAPKCTGIRVIGLHPVVPTAEEFAMARAIQWGDNLAGEELENANRCVREHFFGLYLIELEVEPPDFDIEWIAITQPIADKPSSSWQVPWDERSTGEGRWAFFLHFVQLDQPLKTSAGPIPLPAPTPIPERLVNVKYEMPG